MPSTAIATVLNFTRTGSTPVWNEVASAGFHGQELQQYSGRGWAYVVLNNQNSEDLSFRSTISEGIPASSKILGIKLLVPVWAASPSVTPDYWSPPLTDVQERTIQLTKNGVPVGDNKADGTGWPSQIDSYYVVDDFVGTDGDSIVGRIPTGTAGNSWQVPGGGYVIKVDGTSDTTVGPKYAYTNERHGAIWDSGLGGVADHVAIVDAVATDATCGFLFTPTSGTSGQTYDFIFRYLDENNHYFIRLTHNQRHIQMWRVQGGVLTLLAQGDWTSPRYVVGHTNANYTNQWKVSFSLVGSVIKVVVTNDFNGLLGETTQNQSIDLGSYDLRSVYGFRTTNPNARFDKFWVRGAIERPFTTKEFGGETDLWGTTWTPSEIASNVFGWNIGVQNLVSLDETAAIQPPAAIIYYSNVFNIPVSGGIAGGGAAAITFFDNHDGIGGVVGGGIAEESANLGFTEGGIVVSGTASVPFDVPSNGGVVLSGSANVSRSQTEVGSGGIVASGVAYEQWHIPAQGGIVVAGNSEIQGYIVPLGGIVVGGQHEQTFIDYVDGVGGAIGAGNAGVSSSRIFNYESQSEDSPIIIGGESSGGITKVNLGSSGGLQVAGESTASLSFNLDLEILWRLKSTIKSDLTFLWNIGQLPIYWYRIIGQGRNGGECNLVADPCCQKFIVNIHARTLSELCDKLRARNLNLPIESVQRFSRPAELGAEGFDDECNVLEPVEICQIPKCAEFCVDYENASDQNIWGFNMTVQVDSFFDHEITDGVFVSGSAGVVFERFVPDFPYVATGGITMGGSSEGISSGYAYEAQGGVSISGEANRSTSNWSYVGGQWPSITPNQFSDDQESLMSDPTDKTWSLVERISEEDGLYASTDISYIKTSEFLIARNFHLDIPSGASVLGLKVSIERFATQSGVRDVEVYLVVGDEIISENLADATNDWPVGVSFSPKVYGQNGYDGSGESWSSDPLEVDDLTDPTFGVALRVESSTSLPAIIANVDYIAVEAFFDDDQRLTLGGFSSYVSSSYSYIGNGEIFIGGDADAIQANVLDYVGSGGMVAGGGQADTFNIEAQGGSTVGGEAVVDPIWGEGGFAMGGFAKVTPYFETGEGGSVVGGKSLDSWDKRYEATGGISMGGMANSPEQNFAYEATGGVTMDGTADRSSSAWYWESSGNAIFVLGSAGQSASDFGTSTQVAGFSMTITDMIVEFASDQHVGNAVGLSENIRQCGCLSVPLIVNFEHNFVRDNILSQFLNRNNFVLPSRIELYFSRINTSWQSNLHYKGLSADANTQEVWDIVFELQCTNVMGSIEIGRSIWKLSVQFFRRNLNTGEDFDTRIILGILPEPICGRSANELNFTVIYDTQSNVAAVDPTATIYQSSIFDNIGLFKKPSWITNSNLVFTVSQTGLNIPQVRVDLTEDVLNPLNLLPGEVDPRTGAIWSDSGYTGTGPTLPIQVQNN